MNSAISVEKILEGLKDDFDELDISGKLDEEILNWLDSNWQEDDGGYEIEYDWYPNYRTGEAENVVIEELIKYGVDKYNKAKELEFEDHVKLYNLIQDTFYDLDYS